MSRSFRMWMMAFLCSMACSVAHSQTAGTCTLTLTGAQSAASVPCGATVAYEAATNQTAILVNAPTTMAASGSGIVLVCGIKVSGHVKPGETYLNSSTGVTGACSVQITHGYPPLPAWIAAKGAGSPPDQGSFQTTLTSMGTAYTSSGNSAYFAPTGSITAMLPAAAGSGASTGSTVTLNVSFQGPAKFSAPPPGAGKNPVLHAPIPNQPVSKP